MQLSVNENSESPSSPDIDQLAARLTKLVRRKQKLNKWLQVASLPFLLVAVGPAWWNVFFGTDYDVGVWLLMTFTIAFWGLGAFGVARRNEREIVTVLSQFAGSESVVPLLEASRLIGIDHESLALALTRALSSMSATDASSLTPSHRAILFGLLKQKKHILTGLTPSKPGDWAYQSEDFQLAALSVLSKIGDPEAIPVVRTLASGPTPRVQSAARDCLDAIEQAVAREERASTLLRPSSANPDLLRPAASERVGEERLLRAQAGDPADDVV